MEKLTAKKSQASTSSRNTDRIRTAINEFDRRWRCSSNHRGKIRMSDIQSILTMAKEGTPEDLTINAAQLGFEAGFVIGYRSAQRDSRKHSRHEQKPEEYRQALARVVAQKLAAADESELEVINSFLNGAEA